VETSIEDFPEDELPSEWDWRNVNGYDFTTPIRDQKGCGSCYSLSMLSTLEARTKIMYGKTRILAPQFILDCNYYTEGCDGGWPLLIGFFLESFGVPLESCSPYKAFTVGTSCSDHKNCPPAIAVEKSTYIGGYYGSASESNIMKEIRSRGPVVTDFLVPVTFSYYTSGIFSDDHEKELKRAKKSEEAR
jgi:cathepsin C